ncbi:MAG TPA: DNA repair protein RecO, partial [Microbacterium sp.]|nr:DNA repair protein RecO [Microbacterium sp.]
MAGEWDVIAAAPGADAAAASGVIAAYAQWHLERGIRSLAHVSSTTEEGAR